MANSRDPIEVRCPCCESTLFIDAQLGAVIRHEEPRKAAPVGDIVAAAQKLKGEEARRAAVFQKSFDEHKQHHRVLERKFDELLKQAKEQPDSLKPKRPFDFE